MTSRFRRIRPPTEDISELSAIDDFRVDNMAELHEMTNILYEGLKKLPDEDSRIFFRYYFYGESSAQIAETLSMEKDAVWKRLSRIRAKLKSYLKERGYDHV